MADEFDTLAQYILDTIAEEESAYVCAYCGIMLGSDLPGLANEYEERYGAGIIEIPWDKVMKANCCHHQGGEINGRDSKSRSGCT